MAGGNLPSKVAEIAQTTLAQGQQPAVAVPPSAQLDSMYGPALANSGLARYLPGGIPEIKRQSSTAQTFAPQFALSGLLSAGAAPATGAAGAAGKATAGGGLLGGASQYASSSSPVQSASGTQGGSDVGSWLSQQAKAPGVGWSSDGVGAGARVGALFGSPLTSLLGGAIGGLKITPGSSDTNAEAAAAETASLLARYPAPASSGTPSYTPITGQVAYQPGTDPRGYNANVTYGQGVTGYRNSITGEVTSYNPATHNSAGKYIGTIDYSSFRADDPYRNPGYYGGDEGE